MTGSHLCVQDEEKPERCTRRFFPAFLFEVALTAILCNVAVRGLLHGFNLPYHVRQTGWADTMARIARDIALLVLPAHVPLTPGTCDEVLWLRMHVFSRHTLRG
jgi:hypothetical protein